MLLHKFTSHLYLYGKNGALHVNIPFSITFTTVTRACEERVCARELMASFLWSRAMLGVRLGSPSVYSLTSQSIVLNSRFVNPR